MSADPDAYTQPLGGFTPEVKRDVRATSLDAIRDFLSNLNASTRSDKMPVPMLNQFFDKPNIRREFGHIFVAMMLEWSRELPANDEMYHPDNDPVIKGQEIFAKLDEFREGPEQLIGADSRETVHTLAQASDIGPVRVGRQLLFILQQHPAYGTARDAFMAVELYALEQTGDSAA